MNVIAVSETLPPLLAWSVELGEVAWKVAAFVLVLVVQLLLFWLTGRLFLKLVAVLRRRLFVRLKPIAIQGYELLDTGHQVRLLLGLLRLLRWGTMGVQLLFSVPLLFALFPQTKGLAHRLWSYIWVPAKGMVMAVVDYVPNMFTIALIVYVLHTLVRLARYLAGEVQTGRLKLRGFYADWALPTYHIVRFLLYAFMVAMVYPYLPGARSGVFQGISVFVGLIVSLGSSTVIANIIAGMVITYMRPFKIGDRIALNDTVGNVVEKTALVTRLRTPKNELVTVPNSFVMSSRTVNYTRSARDFGLILHVEVSIGYDVPWRKVHELLLAAAEATEGILPHPSPFVLQTSLSDNYPVYQLNVYARDADSMLNIYSGLYQHIRDGFEAAGVEILSPHYVTVREAASGEARPAT